MPGAEHGPECPFSSPLPALLALGVLVAVSYYPALLGGFIWDDQILVQEQVLHAWPGLWSIWFSPADITREGHYWPIVYTSFWLEHKLWGLAPAGYHAVNVLLHVANVVLVWRLLARLAVPGAWLAAAVFAVHPLHVESVAWIIERKDLLSALFYLAAALAWLRFVEAPRAGRYLPALGLFVAGMLSKPVVVTLPAALLIWHWWKQGRVTAPDLGRLAPFFAVGLGIALADYAFYRSVETVALGYTPVERVLMAARALWFYAGKLLWPVDLAVIYPLWEVSGRDPLAWASLAAAPALAAVLWRGRARWGRGPLAGAAFFAVTLSPTLGFVDFGYMQFSLVADRFQYLAGLGLIAVLAGAGVHAVRKVRVRPAAAAALRGLAAVVLLVLAVLTWRQAGIYRDPVTFFGHIVSHNERARRAHYNLGKALLDAGRLEDSAAANRIAARLDPADKGAMQNLGQALNRLGRYQEAVKAYRAGIAIDPDYMRAHAGLGVALFRLGRHEQALAAMARVLALDPGTRIAADIHPRMAKALLALGRLDEAAESLEHALDADPGNAARHVDLAIVRLRQRRPADAAEHLRRSRRLAAGDKGALLRAGGALRAVKRHEEAVVFYRAALDIDPEYLEARAALGDALYRLQRHDSAIEAMTLAIAQRPKPALAATLQFLLGRARLATGERDAAAGHYEAARELQPDSPVILLHLAGLRFEQGRLDAALDLFRTLVRLDPRKARSHVDLGVVLHRLGRREEAIESIKRALALDPTLESARAAHRAITGKR